MKKFLLLLGMVTCLIGTAACGKADQVQESQLQIDEASLINYSDQVVNALNGVTDHKVEIGSDEAIVEASVSGADHNAVVTLIINDQGSLSSITVNVERSMGELMLNAALNTLMGMGTVFIILILISLLIGCFKFIPQIQEKFSKKNKQPAAAPAAAPVVAAPVEEEEETSDEELIAVIAAAIAASEGSTSTDGFVVRSIRRRSGSWKNA